MNRKAVYLNKSLVEEAMKEAEKTSRELSDHVEYYYQLGVLAEQYEDLPISMIKSLMESTKEEANLVFIPR
jgi:ParD-like antitoxin of type II bacterial toxin-antitoxin system